MKGTTQMVPAITASTITTVAVFLPLAFIGGLVGQVFVGFALTVTFALLASLIVAVTVVPVLAITFLKRSHRRKARPKRNWAPTTPPCAGSTASRLRGPCVTGGRS